MRPSAYKSTVRMSREIDLLMRRVQALEERQDQTAKLLTELMTRIADLDASNVKRIADLERQIQEGVKLACATLELLSLLVAGKRKV